MPFITGTLTIDGYSHPGASPNTNAALRQGSNAAPKIELDGTGAGRFANGLLVKNTAPDSLVRGLVINRFDGSGIVVEPGGRGNRIEGNFIGTDAGDRADLGNGGSGVAIGGLTGGENTIGGVTPASRNLISGNAGDGVGVGSSGNKVQGNYVGTRKDGVGGLSNSGSGVRIGHLGNTVGGAGANAANVIAFNGEDGVKVVNSASTGNRLLRNAIFASDEQGIDLGGDGVTPNDARDRDPGPNALQNFPVIASATTSGTTTTIRGTLGSTPMRTFTLQFFQGPPGPSENETFVGQKKVETNRKGKASFVFTTDLSIPLGRQITATATSGGGSTSEFSDAVTLVQN